ncbi:MAG: septum formation initiator family protein [Bacteroidota bacterium]
MNQSAAFFGRLFQRLRQAAGTKYFIVLAIALVWMLVFDRYNLLSQKKVDKQISEYTKDIQYYKESIKELDYEKARLFSDDEALEQYVREKYYMKKAGEDVFVIVEE